MAFYSFQNTETGEIKDVVQKMDEEHTYSQNGVEWIRLWINPQVSTNIKIDPFSEKDFLNQTSSKKETLGDIFDRAKEASLKREKKLGAEDPIKKKFYEDYSKKRKGKVRHRDEIREQSNKKLKNFGLSVI